MYVAEGEKVPDDCILCNRIYFLRLCFPVGVPRFDSLPMATTGFPWSDLLFVHAFEKRQLDIACGVDRISTESKWSINVNLRVHVPA